MHGKAATIFYSLASFVMFMALFVMQNSAIPEVAVLQDTIQHEFSVAFIQTIGDGPMFEDVALVFDSITEFYRQSAEASVALIQDEASDRDLAFIYGQAYHQVVLAFHPAPAVPVTAAGPEVIADNFMTEPAISNILPAAEELPVGAIAGISTEPVNTQMPWVTMKDNLTGQIYCVALYNGELNKYLGACRYDYH